MSWAGLERMSRIRKLGYLKNLKFDLDGALAKAEKALQAAVVEGSLRNGPKDQTYDSALLQVPLLRYPDSEVNKATVQGVEASLTYEMNGNKHLGYLYRYLRQDDFGRPKSSFLICSFWLVQALAEIGDVERAKKVMDELQKSANDNGLFAEHYCPEARLQTGNFPQGYSHVGQILAAFAISPPWKSVL